LQPLPAEDDGEDRRARDPHDPDGKGPVPDPNQKRGRRVDQTLHHAKHPHCAGREAEQYREDHLDQRRAQENVAGCHERVAPIVEWVIPVRPTPPALLYVKVRTAPDGEPGARVVNVELEGWAEGCVRTEEVPAETVDAPRTEHPHLGDPTDDARVAPDPPAETLRRITCRRAEEPEDFDEECDDE